MTEIPVPPNHPSQAGPVRAKCGACGKTIAVRKDGTFWHHRSDRYAWAGAYRKAVCANSGRPTDSSEES